MTPRFSIVIPTRPRHQTPAYAIQRVLCQSFPDFELAVLDNCSSPETWDMMKQFRTPKLFMGDDDALMPDGLGLANDIRSRAPMDVLSWLKYTYRWDWAASYGAVAGEMGALASEAQAARLAASVLPVLTIQ
mgnify:CR=1 FL=1